MATGRGASVCTRSKLDPESFRLYAIAHEIGHAISRFPLDAAATADPVAFRRAETAADLFGVGAVLLEGGQLSFAHQIASMRAATAVAQGATGYLTHQAIMALATRWEGAGAVQPECAADLLDVINDIVGSQEPVDDTSWRAMTRKADRAAWIGGSGAAADELIQAAKAAEQGSPLALALSEASHLIRGNLYMPGDFQNPQRREDARRVMGNFIEADARYMLQSQTLHRHMVQAASWGDRLANRPRSATQHIANLINMVCDGPSAYRVSAAMDAFISDLGRMTESVFRKAAPLCGTKTARWCTGFYALAPHDQFEAVDLDSSGASCAAAAERVLNLLAAPPAITPDLAHCVRQLCRQALLPTAGRTICEQHLHPDVLRMLDTIAASYRHHLVDEVTRTSLAIRKMSLAGGANPAAQSREGRLCEAPALRC